MILTKKAKLAGVIREHVTNNKGVRWVVDLGRIAGKRQRTYFKDKKSAERHLQLKANEKEKGGTASQSRFI